MINGNDPIETYKALEAEMAYIRKTRKPVLLEANVSRLYGHSSATGANLIPEIDCLKDFEQKLLKANVITSAHAKQLWLDFEEEARTAQEQARSELPPAAASIWDHYFANGENGDWRKF